MESYVTLSDVHLRYYLNISSVFYMTLQSQMLLLSILAIPQNFLMKILLNIELEASEGKLCYISRTNRQNESCYGLQDRFLLAGCYLFEIARSIRPFESDSPTELIYAHVAGIAFGKKISGCAGDDIRIIDKLMAKMPEDRYLSSDGILFDLNECLNEWEAQGNTGI